MSGRRGHSRLGFASEGVLRVLRDVDVRRRDGELIVISREPAIAGDVMTVEHMDSDGVPTVVEVVESGLVMQDGHVRYQLRLRPIRKSQKRRHAFADDLEQR